MQTKQLRKTRWALRAAGCLVIALVTLELCARTEDKLRDGVPFFGRYSLENLYGYDALGKYGMPHASYLKWHLNEAGYRGPALRSGTYRIICIGSSETFGLIESPDMEWPRQLESALNRNGPQGYEVVDVAYPGMTIGTSLKRSPQVLAALRPQMAVIYPSYANYIENDTPQPWPQPATTPGPLHPLKRSELRLPGKIQAALKTALPETTRLWMRSQVGRLSLRGRGGMAVLPEKNIDAFRTDLAHLTETLQQNGVRVVLVTHATRFGKSVRDEDKLLLSDWRQYYPALSEVGFLDMEERMSAAVWQVAAAQHVEVVDAANLIPPGKHNFGDFVHFTDEGSTLFAGYVAEAVQRERPGATPLSPLPRPAVTSAAAATPSPEPAPSSR